MSICHLGGYRALPDKVVKTTLLAGPIKTFCVDKCWADGFVGFLRALGMSMKFAGMTVICTVAFNYLFLTCINGKRRKINAIGTHVSNAPTLIKTLGHHHCLRHGKAKLTRSFLLQGGSCERWRWNALQRLLNNVFNYEVGIFAFLKKSHGFIMAVETPVKFSLNFVAATIGFCHKEHGINAIIRFTLKGLDFAFALYNKLHGYALHATR